MQSIPQQSNRILDYLATADSSLYKIKQEGRNGFLISDCFRA